MCVRPALVLALAALAAHGCYVGRTDPRVALQHGHASSEARAGVFAPCGTPLAEVDGVWAYSNGDATGSADACAGRDRSGALAFQSLELAQRYMHEVFDVQPLWNVEVAAQMCDPGRYPDDVTPYLVGESTPQKGDLAVWHDGGVGHVAIVRDLEGDTLAIVEQNATAAGARTLARSDAGWASDWGTAPDCFVRADVAWDEPPAAGPVEGGDDPDGDATCSDLGSAGACTGDTLVWDDAGTCRVRDCAAEGRTCVELGATEHGCDGGKAEGTSFACASVGFRGACMADDTLVWVQDGACKRAHCPDAGKTCDLRSAAYGYDCV